MLTFSVQGAFFKVERETGGEIRTRDDNDLALAFKAGEAGAFDELVRRYQGRVFAVAYRITLNREEALDVAQEALVKAYRKIDAWQPTGGFLPWLLRLTSNQAIDHLRRRKRHRHEPFEIGRDGGHERTAPGPASADTAHLLRAREIDARIRESLDVLSPTQRVVFSLRHYDDMPLGEVAEVLGCTVGSVKVHLFRALRKLRKELGDLYEGRE